MPELALDRGDIAGLVNDMLAHGVSGIMRGVALNAGQSTNLIPDRVYHPGIEPAVPVRGGVGGQKKRR